MYCKDNPVMYVDPSGMIFKKIWDDFVNFLKNDVVQAVVGTVLSTIAIIGGCLLVATGMGGPIGSMLISAGISSLIGGYNSLSSGGSFFAGWVGGAINGAIAGAFPLGIGRIFGNTLGSFVGSLITDSIDKGFGKNNKSFSNMLGDAGINAGLSFATSWIIGGMFDDVIQFCGKELINELSKELVGVAMQIFFGLCNAIGAIIGNVIISKRNKLFILRIGVK